MHAGRWSRTVCCGDRSGRGSTSPRLGQAIRWPRTVCGAGWMVSALLSASGAAQPARPTAPGGAGTATPMGAVLDFGRTLPRPGDTIIVRYRPTGSLRGAQRLALRGVFHPPDDDQPWVRDAARAAWLERQRDGSFRGRFVFPAGAAYARFAVEDSGGRAVDANGRVPWELSVRDGTGHAPLAAFRSRGVAADPNDVERGLAIAREATTLYPDHPSGWLARLGLESAATAPAARDSVQRAYRAHLDRIDQRLSRERVVDPWDMFDLVGLAARMGDTVRTRAWEERLLREAPTSWAGVRTRVRRLLGGTVPPVIALDSLERLHRQFPSEMGIDLVNVLGVAHAIGDTAAARRWGARVVARDPLYAPYVAGLYRQLPGLERDAAEVLRAHLRFAGRGDAARPLAMTMDEWRLDRGRAVRLTLALHGQGLLALGQPRAAADTLRRAAERGWEGGVWRPLGDAELALGDTAAALRAYAFAVASPMGGARLAESLAPRVGLRADDARWQAAVERAREAMHERVLADALNEPVTGAVLVTDGAGRTQPLSEVIGKRIGLVAVWSRTCPPGLLDLPSFQRLWEAVRARDVGVVAMTREGPSAELDAFRESMGLTFPVHHEDGDLAAPALGARGTPTYLVLDEEGRIRWRGSRAQGAAPVIDALLAAQKARKARRGI